MLVYCRYQIQETRRYDNARHDSEYESLEHYRPTIVWICRQDSSFGAEFS